MYENVPWTNQWIAIRHTRFTRGFPS